MDDTTRFLFVSKEKIQVLISNNWKLMETHDILGDLSNEVTEGIESAADE